MRLLHKYLDYDYNKSAVWTCPSKNTCGALISHSALLICAKAFNAGKVTAKLHQNCTVRVI